MSKKYTYFIIVFLIVSSFISFGRILGNDFINFDDNLYITENSHIKSGVNIETIKWAFTTTYFSYWHPLTWLSYMLEWRLFGANAADYHFVSLLLHIGTVLFLFLFLNKTTKSLWSSAFVAAVFALHPLRVESVAWAAERKDVLSMFFGMATLYAYAFYVENKKISKYFICLALFALSLMSKPMLVTLPFVLLLLDYWPLGRWQKALNPPPTDKTRVAIFQPQKKKGKKSKADIVGEKKIATPVKSRRQLIKELLGEKAPFILLSIILSISLIWQQKAVRGMVTLEEINFPTRIINALVSYVAYLGKIFWPVDLAVFYPYQHSLPLWQVFGSVVILLVVSFAAVYLIKKAPFLFVGWFWYLGTLFPVIGLLQAGAQARADRYTYLPSIGIALMLVWGLLYLVPKERLRKMILLPAAGIVLFVLTILTWQQCGYWRDSFSIFSHALNVTENNYLAHNNLGAALAASGKNEEAITHYLEAIKINPANADAHCNLGKALATQGKNEEAITHYLEAIKINPTNDEAQYNLAILFQNKSGADRAIEHYREALRINPNYSSAHINLGACLVKQQKYDEAIYHYRQALRIDPDDPGIYFNLGMAMGNKGELQEAIEYFRRAIFLKPDYKEARQALKMALEIEQELARKFGGKQRKK